MNDCMFLFLDSLLWLCFLFFVDAIGGSKNVSAPPCLQKVTYMFEIMSQEITCEASKIVS